MLTGPYSKALSQVSVTGVGNLDYEQRQISSIRSCSTFCCLRVLDELPALRVSLNHSVSKIPIQELTNRAFEVVIRSENEVILQLLSVEFQDIFLRFCDDLCLDLEGTVSADVFSGALLPRISKWVAFFTADLSDGLSRSARVGLFGELSVFEDLGAQLGYEEILQNWTGPKRKSHDFQSEECSIEVKTTTAATPEKIWVSNARQLNPVFSPHLFLIVVKILESAHSGRSLQDLVRKITESLSDVSQLKFRDLLRDVGYVDGQSKRYQDERYVLAGIQSYSVDSSFPHVEVDELMAGVTDIKYCVSIASIAACEVELESIMERFE